MTRAWCTASCLLMALLSVHAAPLPADEHADHGSADGGAGGGAKPSSHGYDVLVFGDQQPVLLRLHIWVNDKPLEEHWRTNIAQTFEYLDANEDGQLDATELADSPYPRQQPVDSQPPNLFSSFIDRLAARSQPVVEEKQPEQVDLPQYQQMIRPANAPLQLGRSASIRRFDGELYTLLDRDNDRQLTRQELADLERLACQRDLDGDEALSLQELHPFENPLSEAYGRQLEQQESIEVGDFAIVQPDHRFKLVRRLAERYGGRPEQWTVKLENMQPTWDCELHLAGDADERSRLQAKQPDQDPIVRTHGRLALVGDHNLVLLDAGAFQSFDPVATYDSQFKNADRDNNGYLEMDESQATILANVFTAMDRDGDEKLYHDEMRQYLKRHVSAGSSRVVLTVVDDGLPLFTLLDADGDGRLSYRERLRGRDPQWHELWHWDRNGDAMLARTELPHAYYVAMGRGQPSRAGSIYLGSMRFDVDRVNVSPPNRGPIWFRKLDRNQDGDVSRSEFPGPAADFQRLDRNSDQLIYAAEADADR